MRRDHSAVSPARSGRILAVFLIDVYRPATLGLREKAESLVYAARDRGLAVDAAFPAGRSVILWDHREPRPPWGTPPRHGGPESARAYRYWSVWGDLPDASRAGYDVLWLRDMPPSPPQIAYLTRAHRRGVAILLDIPTYPFHKPSRAFDGIARALAAPFQRLRARRLDRVATISTHERIWGVPTLQVSNGIPWGLGRVAPTTPRGPRDGREAIRCVGIAQWARWHGLARLFRGVARAGLRDSFEFVLGGVGPESPRLLDLAASLDLRVRWCGPLYGEERTDLLRSGDVGIGTLSYPGDPPGHSDSLKHGLYAAHGLPFVAADRDRIWASVAGVHAVSAQTPHVDAREVLRFALRARKLRQPYGQSLRAAAAELTWDKTYAPVFDYLARLVVDRR